MVGQQRAGNMTQQQVLLLLLLLLVVVVVASGEKTLGVQRWGVLLLLFKDKTAMGGRDMARRDQRTKDTTRSKGTSDQGKLGDQGKEHQKRERQKQQGSIRLNTTIISCQYWSSDDSTNIDECCLSENERKTQINQRVGSWEIREKEIGQINKNQG